MRTIISSATAPGTLRFALLLPLVALGLSCSDTAPTGPMPTDPLLTVGGTPNKQDWKQCQNNKDITGPCKWVTGNLNKQHNLYFEGDVVPHALRIPQILDGNPIDIVMTYGFKKANKSTHDFLARWNATQTNANPCVDGSFAPFCTAGVLNAISTRSGDMADEVKAASALCGGNDLAEMGAAIAAFDASFPAGGAYPNGQKVIEGINLSSIEVTDITTACSANGDAETTLRMTITPNAAGIASKHALLLIGSHIASGIYWETFGGAGGVRGSPYHLGLVTVDGRSAGSMDLQMSADAVATPGASLAIQKQTIDGTGSFNFTGTGSGIPNNFSRNTATQGNPTTTAAFQITNLQFGDKYVQETVPTGWELTDIQCTANGATVVIGQGGSGAFVNGGSNGFDTGDNTVKVTVGSGHSPTCTFVNTEQPGTISGLKFHDLNGNGVNNTEPGLSGWTIRLYDENGDFVTSTTTSGLSGGYSFASVPAGTYRVCEVLQSNWTQSHPTSGPACNQNGVTDEAPIGHTVVLSAGGTASGHNFGNYQNVSLRVRKYEDSNADGDKDVGESFILWGTNAIHVFGISGTTGDFHGTISNAADGVTFSVPPGTYRICETIPSGWFQSQPAASATVDCSTHTDAAGKGFELTVQSGDTEQSRQFGNYQGATITVKKWNDEDGSGTKNGEDYITWAADIHVFNSGLSVHQHAQITDADNGVSFTVPPGTYTICETQISGWTQTFPGAGVNCSGHGAGLAANGFSVGVASGGSATREFGNRVPPPESDALFILIDEDGIDNGPRYWEDTGPFNAAKLKSFTTNEVNDDMPGLARRSQLRYFAANAGKIIWLWSGQVGDEGWFAPKTIPSSWAGAGPTSDGLRNFLGNPSADFPHNVGPGLGTGSNPESLLDEIPNVIPLRAEGLYQLIGRTVCALVWDSDISINYGPIKGSLKGEKLGVAAFTVLDVVYLNGFSSSTLPRVRIEIKDANQVCEADLSLFTTAPVPSSSSEPADIRPNYTPDNNGYVN